MILWNFFFLPSLTSKLFYVIFMEDTKRLEKERSREQHDIISEQRVVLSATNQSRGPANETDGLTILFLFLLLVSYSYMMHVYSIHTHTHAEWKFPQYVTREGRRIYMKRHASLWLCEFEFTQQERRYEKRRIRYSPKKKKSRERYREEKNVLVCPPFR